jgi:arylsulfatase
MRRAASRWLGRALAAVAWLAAGCNASGQRPDVVLVVVDTLRADHLGSYGFPLPTSPHLDRFADEAVVFERALAASSNTVPSHASLMTSRFVRGHSVGWINGSSRLEGRVTLAMRFREAGYETAAFVSNFVLRRSTGLDAGFELYDDVLPEAERNRPEIFERRAEATTARALEWLAARGARPVFLFVHYQDPHGPYTPPPERDDAFASLEAGESPALPWLTDDDSPGGIPRYQQLPGLDRLGQYERRYAGEIAYFDASLGRLLEALAARPRPRVVLITADHGESFGEGGFYLNHGHATTPDLAHVPLLIRAPGLAPGRRADPVHHVDVAPTLLELAGLAAAPDASGLALGPFLRDEKPLPERLLFCDVGAEVSAYADGRFLRARLSELGHPTEYTAYRWAGTQSWDPIPTRAADQGQLAAYLRARERMQPIPETLSESDRARLRALGYLGDE